MRILTKTVIMVTLLVTMASAKGNVMIRKGYDPLQPRDDLGRWTALESSIRRAAGLEIESRYLLFSDLGITMGDEWRDSDREAFLGEVRTISDKLGGADVFRDVYGDMHVQLIPTDDGSYSCWSSMRCYGNIQLDEASMNTGILSHELGHKFLNELELRGYEYSIGYYDDDGNYVHVSGYNPITAKHIRTSLGYPEPGLPYEQHGAALNQTKLEDFADMFRGWVLDDFSDDEAGRARQAFMDEFIANALKDMK